MPQCDWCGQHFNQRPDLHLSHALDPGGGTYCSRQCEIHGRAQQKIDQKKNAEAFVVFSAVAAVIVLFLLPAVFPLWIFSSAGFSEAVVTAFGSVWAWLWSTFVWAAVIAALLPKGRAVLASWFSSLKSSSFAASSFIAKQTERTKIMNISLPQAFMSLGGCVYSAKEFREDFAAEFEELDATYAKVEQLEAQAKSRPAGEKLTDKAKAIAALTKDRAEAQALRLKIARMKAKLGRAAYEQHGKGLDAPEVIASIVPLLARSDALSKEIDELSQQSEGHLITPQRLAVGGIVTLVGVIAFVIVSWFDGSPAKRVDSELQGSELHSADLSFDIGKDGEVDESDESDLIQGVIAFQSFAENPSRSANSARFVGKPLAITGEPIYVVPLDAGTRAGFDVSSLGLRAVCWFRGESAKQVSAADEVRLHVLGTYKGIADVGGLELTDCRLVASTDMAAAIQAVTQPPPTTQAIASTTRTLETRIGTTMETPVWIHRNFNPSLQHLRCRATNDQLVLDFDVDTDLWAINGNRVGWRLPLFIRLADRNGNILTHFTTVEGFTVFPEVHMSWNEKYEHAVRGRMPADMLAKTKCELLTAQGNRLVYTVNMRHLRDAAIVEVGFYQEL